VAKVNKDHLKIGVTFTPCEKCDRVEVVRCKDCKWFGRDMGYGKHDCKKYEMPYCLADDFCSYGERREGE
jgi:hypothetical protein